MGCITDYQLRHLPPAARPGELHEIGAASARLDCSATIIRRRKVAVDKASNTIGVWFYEEELPIHVEPIQYQEAPFRNGEVLLWTGMQVQLKAIAKNLQWKHKHLVASLWPYSRNWFVQAAFRPPKHRRKAQIMDGLWKQLSAERQRRLKKDPVSASGAYGVASVASESALPAALAALRYDPFETNDDWLTARLPDPMRYRWPDIEALGPGFSIARNPNFKAGLKAKQPRWYFGVCENLQAACEEIRMEVLANPRLWELPRRPSGPHSRALDNVDAIVDAAVWQALAGREGDVGVKHRNSRVAQSAVRIVRERLENESKVFDRR